MGGHDDRRRIYATRILTAQETDLARRSRDGEKILDSRVPNARQDEYVVPHIGYANFANNRQRFRGQLFRRQLEDPKCASAERDGAYFRSASGGLEVDIENRRGLRNNLYLSPTNTFR